MNYKVAISQKPVYTVSYSGKHNCINHNGHSFELIRDKDKCEQIRLQYPKMKCALWQCVHCEKITESM